MPVSGCDVDGAHWCDAGNVGNEGAEDCNCRSGSQPRAAVG